MNDVTLDKLEFDEVRETLVAFCGTALGKRLARSMIPSTRSEVVSTWLRQVRELLAVAEGSTLPPLGGIHDIRDFVRASAFPAPLIVADHVNHGVIQHVAELVDR